MKFFSICLYGLLIAIFFFGSAGVTAQSLSLDGAWEIIFDDKNEGREAKWMNKEIFGQHPDRQNIQVPIAWETLKEDYEGVAFYRKSFDVPKDWEGKTMRLQFGAVNYLTEVWLNDEVLGFHEGGFTPFEFRVDEIIKTGESNVLTLRVVGPLFLTDKEIDGMKALETPQWRGGITGGIWQSVELLATGETFVDDVYIEPKIQDNTTKFHVNLDYTGILNSRVEIEINIREAKGSGNIVGKIREDWPLHSGKNQQSWTLEIPDAKYWSPDNPHLYVAEVIVKQSGKLSDTWTTRFGMRELTIKDKDFYLNGKRIYIKASFFEGLYPNGVAHPDSEEMVRKEIRMAKEAGFNMIRPWRRPPVPMWLDLADEMGVLVVGSPALECMTLPLSTPYLPARVENEVRESILRDRNRACIVQWELFNELHRPILNQMMRPMAMLARELDPTRLILDESGGWAFGANMYLPNDYEATKFNDIHNYPGPFINRDRYDGYLSIGMTKEEKKAAGLTGKTPGKNVVPGLMSYVSELGYGSLPDLTQINQQFKQEGNPLTPAYRYHKRIAEGQERIMKESGFENIYPNMQDFYLDQQAIHGTANKRMIEAVRANPEVDGYCIHALVAGDWILGAGLMDVWRNPKSYAYEGTKAANQPRIISIRSEPRNIYASQGSNLEIIGINEWEDINAELHIEIVSAKGKRVFSKSLKKEWESGVSHLFKENLKTDKWKGNYTIKAKVLGKGKQILAENSYGIDVFQQRALVVPQNSIAIWENEGALTTFLEKSGVSITSFDSNTDVSTPVIVSGNLSEEGDRAQELLAFMQKGGTALYIEGPQDKIEEKGHGYPFQAKVHPAVGLWTCIPHLVQEHPIFKGLPSATMMRDIYENVWAMRTLRNLKFESGQAPKSVVASLGFDWFSRDHKMHYSGPGEAWWGADIAEVSFGKGRCLVSQLRIVDNLGKDPVADKILFNMIRYVSKN